MSSLIFLNLSAHVTKQYLLVCLMKYRIKLFFCFKHFCSQVASSVERPAADGEEAEKSNGHVAEVFFHPLVVFV